MANYGKGAAFERFVCDYLRATGYYAVRSAGSHGEVDVVAWNQKNVLLIQCKVEKKRKSYKEELQRLRSVPAQAGWLRQLWVRRWRGSVMVTVVGRAKEVCVELDAASMRQRIAAMGEQHE